MTSVHAKQSCSAIKRGSKSCLQAFVLFAQVQSKDALSSCLGWRLEAADNAGLDASLTLRFGSLFKARVPMPGAQQQADAAEATLELAPTGVQLILLGGQMQGVLLMVQTMHTTSGRLCLVWLQVCCGRMGCDGLVHMAV